MIGELAGYTQIVPIQCSDQQWRFLESSARYSFLSGGFGSGKSHVLREKARQRFVQNKGLAGMYIASDYGRLNRDVLPPLFDSLDDLGWSHEWIKGKIPGTSSRALLIGEGWLDVTLYVGSMENPDAIKGPNLAFILCEEMTLFPRFIPGKGETTWSLMVSRLRLPGGTNSIDGSGTPEGKANWTEDPGNFGRAPDEPEKMAAWLRDYRRIHTSTYDNPFTAAGYVDQLIATMDPKQVREKVFGYAAAEVGGAIYYEFDRDRNVDPISYDMFRGDVLIGLDFNVDPMSATLSQFAGGQLYTFGEIVLPDSHTRAMAQKIKERLTELQVPLSRVRVFPDASGAARKTSGETDFKILREEGLTALVYPDTGNPRVADRFNTVNGALYHQKWWISPKCGGLIRDLQNYVKDSRGEPIKTPTTSHLTDGAGYLIMRLLPIRTAGRGIVRAA